MEAIAYYRESTNSQQIGIDAQRTIVEQYARDNNIRLILEYVEHKSGRINNRPLLTKALEKAKATGVSIIVAKADRLTRDASFGMYLFNNYNIIFCDHPNMDAFNASVYFGMAQQESELISQRTKQALQALKAKGKKLGKPNATWTDEQRKASWESRRASIKSNEANRKAWALVSLMQGTWTAKAEYLNAQGFLTAKGGIWRGNQVKRLAEIYANETAKL